MIEVMDSGRLTELVIEKHHRFLETYNVEFSELEAKLTFAKQQEDENKKEMEYAETRINVFNEKYHLLFHHAKKQREELFSAILGKLRSSRAPNVQDITRLHGRIEEYEKKLQNTKNVDDEEKVIAGMKKLLFDFESQARKAGISVSCKGIVDILNEANASHKELLGLQNKPKQHAEQTKDYDTQKREIETRHSWLKHRIESHRSALAYWEKQKGGVKVG